MKYSTRLCVNVGSPIYLKEEKEKREKGNKREEEGDLEAYSSLFSKSWLNNPQKRCYIF